MKYILNAFYIYRETVNRGFFAPHVFVDGAYEWSSNVHFSWSDIAAVISFGEPAYNTNDSNIIKIEAIHDGKMHSKTIRRGITGIVEDTVVRDIISSRDEIHKLFKYSIDSLSDVSVLFSDMWQNASLETYVNPITRAIHAFKNGRIDKETIDIGLIEYIRTLETYIRAD